MGMYRGGQLESISNGSYEAEVFKDGLNANRDDTDYKKEVLRLSSGAKLPIQLSGGGGWVARIGKVN